MPRARRDRAAHLCVGMMRTTSARRKLGRARALGHAAESTPYRRRCVPRRMPARRGYGAESRSRARPGRGCRDESAARDSLRASRRRECAPRVPPAAWTPRCRARRRARFGHCLEGARRSAQRLAGKVRCGGPHPSYARGLRAYQSFAELSCADVRRTSSIRSSSAPRRSCPARSECGLEVGDRLVEHPNTFRRPRYSNMTSSRLALPRRGDPRVSRARFPVRARGRRAATRARPGRRCSAATPRAPAASATDRAST